MSNAHQKLMHHTQTAKYASRESSPRRRIIHCLTRRKIRSSGMSMLSLATAK